MSLGERLNDLGLCLLVCVVCLAFFGFVLAVG